MQGMLQWYISQEVNDRVTTLFVSDWLEVFVLGIWVTGSEEESVGSFVIVIGSIKSKKYFT